MSDVTPAQQHIITVHIGGPSYGHYTCTCGWRSRTASDGSPQEEQDAQQAELNEHTTLRGHPLRLK